jgi:hypothetical protein
VARSNSDEPTFEKKTEFRDEPTTFYSETGIEFKDFVAWYEKQANHDALIKEANQGIHRSTALGSILSAFEYALPNLVDHLRVRTAFELSQRDIQFLRERLTAYAADQYGSDHRATLVLTTSAAIASSSEKLLRENGRTAATIFSSRFDCARKLFEQAKIHGLNAIGRKVSLIPSNHPDATTLCKQCKRFGHATSHCADFVCSKCDIYSPGHFPDSCPNPPPDVYCQFCHTTGHTAVDCPIVKCYRCKRTFRECGQWCEPRDFDDHNVQWASAWSEVVNESPPPAEFRWENEDENGEIPGWTTDVEWAPAKSANQS